MNPVAIEGFSVADHNNPDAHATATDAVISGQVSYVPGADGYVDLNLAAVLSQSPSGVAATGSLIHWRLYQSFPTYETTLAAGAYADGNPATEVRTQLSIRPGPSRSNSGSTGTKTASKTAATALTNCSAQMKVEARPAWTMTRDTAEPIADVVAAQGATIQQLASMLGLSYDQWQQWLTIPSGQPVPARVDQPLAGGEDYKIPNTIATVYLSNVRHERIRLDD